MTRRLGEGGGRHSNGFPMHLKLLSFSSEPEVISRTGFLVMFSPAALQSKYYDGLSVSRSHWRLPLPGHIFLHRIRGVRPGDFRDTEGKGRRQEHLTLKVLVFSSLNWSNVALKPCYFECIFIPHKKEDWRILCQIHDCKYKYWVSFCGKTHEWLKARHSPILKKFKQIDESIDQSFEKTLKYLLLF